ncbi:cache domain-containing protein, partial [Thiospirillum jenense]
MRTTVLILTTLIIIILAWWTLFYTDRELRDDLSRRIQFAAQAIDIKKVARLSGSAADLTRPEYLKLKEQLATLCDTDPSCQFLYLIGRHPDGQVFFFADSAANGAANESPAGQLYDEADAELIELFTRHTAATSITGPITDRWGTWISALVPFILPTPQIANRTQPVFAVLGMDVAIGEWRMNIATRAALPIGTMLILFIGVMGLLIGNKQQDSSPKPVLWRLFLPLTTAACLLLTASGFLLWQQHLQYQQAQFADLTVQIQREWRTTLQQQIDSLTIAIQPLTIDGRIHNALRKKDKQALQRDWQALFTQWKDLYHITHFYFFDANRYCILRLHQPDRYSDQINRFTAINAEDTGATAAGIELGPLGTFTLRVVQPVIINQKLLGYIELGKEIEDVLQTLETRTNVQLAVVIRKAALQRTVWEVGMKRLGREANWDYLPDGAVIYATTGQLPAFLIPWADGIAAHLPNELSVKLVKFEKKTWQVAAIALYDAGNNEIGELFVTHDLSNEVTAFIRRVTFVGTIGTILLILSLTLLFILLRRTDRTIDLQQAALRDSEQRHRLLFEHSTSAIAIHDLILDAQGQPTDYVL